MLHFHYHGNVIEDAGNGVLFVGARESWYPHLGDPAEFAAYDLAIRWPRKLRLVATGSKLNEHEEGEFRIGHWKTEKPTAVAGFNLGEYASSSVTSGGSTGARSSRATSARPSGATRPSSSPRTSSSRSSIERAG